ncbi:MAG: helix-turn-helix transcriptional regulator [Planctomycetota bacterium]
MSSRLRRQFGERLRQIRLERALTQEQFAELVGISVDFLSLIERGINAPSFDSLEQIAGRLGVPVAFLFTFPADKRTQPRQQDPRGR